MKYGLLISSSFNAGDDIQSAVVRPLLPRVDAYLDYDFLRSTAPKQKTKLIIHGCCRPKEWPPPRQIKPLIISFHIADTAVKKLTSGESIAYFRKHEPIGCRDTFTLNLLRSYGVKCYFSGCITFMLDRRPSPSDGEILLTDLDREVYKHLPREILERATILSHGGGIPMQDIANILYRSSPKLHGIIKSSRIHILINNIQQGYIRMRRNGVKIEDRLAKATALLERYADARLVITSRLHAVLPCAALGTPAVLIHRDLKDPRLTGLMEYIRAYAVKDAGSIDFGNRLLPSKQMDILRIGLIQSCRQFLYED